MGKISYEKLKPSLAHFFVKVEKYKAHKLSSENTIYLYNEKLKYQVIIITLDKFNEDTIANVSKQMKKAKHDKIKVLKIALSSNFVGDKDLIVISDPDLYKDNLLSYFPKIESLVVEEEREDEEISQEEIIEMLENPEQSKNKELRDLTAKIKAGFTPASWCLIMAFIIIPVCSYGASIYFSMKGNSYLSNSSVSSLFFGATDHNLTVLGNQWWRVFTYGFNVGPTSSFISIVEFILISMSIYSLTRYIEASTGTRRLIIVALLTYVMNGFFVSMVPQYIFGGSYPVLCVLVGILAFSKGKKGGAVEMISKSKLIFPSLLIAILPMLDGDVIKYLELLICVGTAGCFIYIWNYNYKKISYDLIAPLVSIGIVMFLPFVLIFAYAPVPAYSGADIYTLQSYLTQGWLKTTSSATSTLHSIGWTNLEFQYDDNAGQYMIYTTGEFR